MKKAKTVITVVIMAFCVAGPGGCNNKKSSPDTKIYNSVIVGEHIESITGDDSGNSRKEGSDTEIKIESNAAPSSPPGAAIPAPEGYSRLPMTSGWYAWDEDKNKNIIGIKPGDRANECTIYSAGKMAGSSGISNEKLGPALNGKTSLLLFFSNTKASTFSPEGICIVEFDGYEYAPVKGGFPGTNYVLTEDTPPEEGVEYKIPDNFKGKIDIKFYRSDIHDLKIAAFCR